MDSEKFLSALVDHYELNFYRHYYCAHSTDELITHHNQIKENLLSELPSKWVKEYGLKLLPSDARERLEKEIDETFARLKKKFEKKQTSDLSALSAQQDAIRFYNEEQDNYFEKHPNATPNEIEDYHRKLETTTLIKAGRWGSTRMTNPKMAALKTELHKRRMLYASKALWGQRTLEDPAIGIDLGTTMCCVKVFHKGTVHTIPNRAQGSTPTTPSYVTYNEDNSSTFGWVAKEDSYLHPETTIYETKRMIGREWNDSKLQEFLKHWPFEVVNEDNQVKIRTWKRNRFPHEVSARLLSQFRSMAAKYLNLPYEKVRKAVITVPAYFTEPQRRLTREAGILAGLEVLNILSEPTAAAIAYSWERTDSGTRRALIYDLGGGTFDVAIAEIQTSNVEILVVNGDSNFGGRDFDNLLIEHCVNVFHKESGINLLAKRKASRFKTVSWAVGSVSNAAITRLKIACEKAKERLSTTDSTVVDVMGICKGKNLSVEISRKKLEELILPLVSKTIETVKMAIIDAKAKGLQSKDDIDDIILVGGSTRTPIVIETLKNFFPGANICQNINPDEAVAYGAAVQAAQLNNAEDTRNIAVQDVTPLPLGIQMVNDVYSRILTRNTPIPCTAHKDYVTVRDNQTEMQILIYQGEDDIASNNQLLGKFTLKGIPPKPKGREGAKVTMSLNDMGILQVKAVQRSTGETSGIVITSEKLGMSVDQISRLTHELSLLDFAPDECRL